MLGKWKIVAAGAVFGALAIPPSAIGSLLDQLKGAMEGAQKTLAPSSTGETAPGALSVDEVARGLRQALEVGAKKAVANASAVGGFLDDPKIRIPLPEKLQSVAGLLKTLGFGDQVTSFDATMNHAAEKASAKALPIFGDAISKLTFDDVNRIWKGGDTAATDYLKTATWDQLYQEFEPVVHQAAQSVGVTRSYEQLTSLPEVTPFISGGDLDLDHYVTTHALGGVFTLLAEEEKKIRTDPVAQTTDLLKKLFSSP